MVNPPARYILVAMNHVLQEGKNALLILLGMLSAAFGLKGFLISSRFIDGGVTIRMYE